MTAAETHSLLVAEAAAQSLPEFYKEDLTKHDLAELTKSGTRSFLWVLRTCGTFLVRLDDPKPSDFHSVAALLKACECSDPRVLWYHFQNGRLSPISYAQALELAGLPTCYRQVLRPAREEAQ